MQLDFTADSDNGLDVRMPSKKGGKKKKKEFGQMADKTLSPTADNCFCACTRARACVCETDCAFSCLFLYTHTHGCTGRENRRCSVWAGQFDAHFYDRVAVLLVVARRLKCRLSSSPIPPPPPPPAGGLGCRLWLRDPLLLCSPGWSQEGLCRRGQHYGTARRGTPTPLRLH